jgi:hypothetical protein
MKKKNDSYGRMEEDLTVKEFFISFLIGILFIGLMFCLFSQISKVAELVDAGSVGQKNPITVEAISL